MRNLLAVCFSLITFYNLSSQTIQNDNYQFFVDLNKVTNDQLTIELITPKIASDIVSYKFPAMVPGTYKVYNFGRFVSDLKAFSETGIELTVTKPDINTWEISDAASLYKITYKIDDTFGDSIKPVVFEPVGTSIEEGTIFVVNNQGFFGYLDGYITNDFTVTFTKPEGFYGSTSLVSVSRTDTEEIFTAPDYQFLVDSPLFFNKPDTTSINFDETKVLVSVYSPGKGMTSKDLAQSTEKLLQAIRKYLGGKLPADRYTFLFYFTNKAGSGSFGALEHNYSSMYFMPDVPASAKSFMIKQLLSTCAHEFYHIVTPLNLHSEEIGIFDFANPVMSKHLWLYEGTTEYSADYIQLREGLMTLKEYAEIIQEKLNGASRYNDSLPFTELSKGALDVYEEQYINVYQKGALIGLCLDILIREESNGAQGWQDVVNKLLQKYGMERSFKDEDLFGDIEALTSPKIREFLETYVAGPNKIPYDEIFAKVGLVVKSEPYQAVNSGSISLGFNEKTYRLTIAKISDPDNDFIKSLGLKENDEIVSVNGSSVSYFNIKDMFGSVKKQFKTGDDFEMVVMRQGAGGKDEKVTLKTKIPQTKTAYEFSVTVNDKLTGNDKVIRGAWLGK